ncbi:hypothetical protein MAPG_10299 [Magnaporthiopsis poae ATCC 64411]|uniref:Uncharacterized protein n=1 Tax=Magnaporthiopsis poae (strain ATCC 64411 / 73-15) TaxID=644358 RepID=A0A0C4EC85_MAGP6|nr:hypothetical protein MAPG_10299 [Magnaporthiopsis poae ATCC 64411]
MWGSCLRHKIKLRQSPHDPDLMLQLTLGLQALDDDLFAPRNPDRYRAVQLSVATMSSQNPPPFVPSKVAKTDYPVRAALQLSPLDGGDDDTADTAAPCDQLRLT